MKKIVFLGNSHLGAFVQAQALKLIPDDVDLRFLKITDPRYARNFVRTSDGLVLSGALEEDLLSAKADGFEIVTVIGGNAHNVFALVQHEIPFDFTHPKFATATRQATVRQIPIATVRAALADQIVTSLAQIACIAAKIPIRQLESPPPVESADFMRAHINKTFVKLGVQEAGITPAPIRLKLWQAHSDLYSERMAQVGMPYVPCIAIARDDAGYLKEEFSHPDGTHANAAYGALCVDALVATREEAV